MSTADLCFLVALRAAADREGLAAFEEDRLVDLFVQVCDLTDPGAPNPRKRATHAIQDLRTQRLLGRVDGAGLVRAGEYALTRLGTAVVDFFLEDEALTRESLTVLTTALLSQLAEVLAASREAQGADAWRARVGVPLRVTVRDLVAGIERRQRGMDAQQEQIRATIGGQLGRDWFGAVETCEALLDETARTLRELHEVLLRDAAHLLALLQDIDGLARAADSAETLEAIRQVEEQVERVRAWGESRQRAWSEYFQFVQRYLRDVVRLDPDRALSQRLRDQLSGWPTLAWRMVTAQAPPVRVLRSVEAVVERPPVTRPRADRERPLADVVSDPAPRDLEAAVEAALRSDATDLAAVLDLVLPSLDPAQRYRAVGRVAALVAARRRVRAPRERDWVVVEDLEVEQWALDAARRS